MLMGIIQFTDNAKETQVTCRCQVLLQVREDGIQCKRGGAGPRQVKGQLIPITGGMRRVWVQMELGKKAQLWEDEAV